MSEHRKNRSRVWRTSGGSNARTGLFDGKVRIGTSPSCREVEGGIRASPVFDGIGNCYLASMAGMVSSYTPDGDERWRVRLPAGISASPALNPSDKAVFLGTVGGEVCALDPLDGRTLWKRGVPSQSDRRILSDLLFLPVQDLVVLNSWGGQFHALEAETGVVRISWSAGISSFAAAAAAANGRLYALRAESTEARSGLVCFSLDPWSGEETEILFQPGSRRAANRMKVAASPIVDEMRQRLFIVTNVNNDSRLHAYSLVTNQFLWSRNFNRFIVATPTLMADGSVAVGDLSGVVHVVSPSGSLQHRYHTGAYYLLAGPVCDSEGTVFIGDPEGKLHLLSPEGTGTVIFEAGRSIEGRPAFDPGGRLYLPSMEGNVYVFSRH